MGFEVEKMGETIVLDIKDPKLNEKVKEIEEVDGISFILINDDDEVKVKQEMMDEYKNVKSILNNNVKKILSDDNNTTDTILELIGKKVDGEKTMIYCYVKNNSFSEKLGTIGSIVTIIFNNNDNNIEIKKHLFDALKGTPPKA